MQGHALRENRTAGSILLNMLVAAVSLFVNGFGVYLTIQANLGAAPTFGIDRPTLEVHLLDFHGDLYGQTVNVEFLHRLRDIEHFSTPEALQQQLQKDLEQTRLWS